MLNTANTGPIPFHLHPGTRKAPELCRLCGRHIKCHCLVDRDVLRHFPRDHLYPGHDFLLEP